jgi:hypothetical protein
MNLNSSRKESIRALKINMKGKNRLEIKRKNFLKRRKNLTLEQNGFKRLKLNSPKQTEI